MTAVFENYLAADLRGSSRIFFRKHSGDRRQKRVVSSQETEDRIQEPE